MLGCEGPAWGLGTAARWAGAAGRGARAGLCSTGTSRCHRHPEPTRPLSPGLSRCSEPPRSSTRPLGHAAPQLLSSPAPQPQPCQQVAEQGGHEVLGGTRGAGGGHKVLGPRCLCWAACTQQSQGDLSCSDNFGHGHLPVATRHACAHALGAHTSTAHVCTHRVSWPVPPTQHHPPASTAGTWKPQLVHRCFMGHSQWEAAAWAPCCPSGAGCLSLGTPSACPPPPPGQASHPQGSLAPSRSSSPRGANSPVV